MMIRQEIDPIQVISSVGKRNRRSQAVILQAIESVVDKDSEEYQAVRKLVLDEMNSLARSYVRLILTDSDFMV